MGDIVEFKVSKHKKMIKRKALEPIHPPVSLVWFCPNKYCPEHRPFLLTNKLSKCPDAISQSTGRIFKISNNND